MANKTAMQQMLEWTRKTFPMDLDTPRMIEDKIESLLKVEKEQIKNAYRDYHDLGHIYGLDTEEYYNEIYGSQAPQRLEEADGKIK